MKRITFALLLLTLVSSFARADWVLDGERSALSFVSTKAINVAEVHRFTRLSGGVDSGGQVSISINLASVDTGIEIRDDRMRAMLFKTEQFASAEITAKVDTAKIADLEAGQSVDMTVEGVLNLHGEMRPLLLELVVARSGASQLLVMSRKPVVVNAPEFNLAEGVEALRAIAGLPSISLAVPVSFVIAFEQN
jgi:polyisoprenoid-binding protein YceI